MNQLSPSARFRDLPSLFHPRAPGQAGIWRVVIPFFLPLLICSSTPKAVTPAWDNGDTVYYSAVHDAGHPGRVNILCLDGHTLSVATTPTNLDWKNAFRWTDAP